LTFPSLPNTKNGLRVFFDDNEQQRIRERFGALGTVWQIPPDGKAGETEYIHNFISSTPPVNFDPPWLWKSPPPKLFHSPPPAWYDPWGYNRPGDFINEQPSPTYFDPFCFDSQLRLPQRRVTFDSTFKGRRWAVFTDNDPASLLASVTAASEEMADAEPVLPQAAPEPSALVITADEDRQRTVFQLLPLKPVRTTFDTTSHNLDTHVSDFGSISKPVVATPTVFRSPRSLFPTAWCVVNPEFPSARLRKLVARESNTGASLWDKFVDENESKFGPRDGELGWQIDKCPLPSDVLPMVCLDGYALPAPV